MPSTQPIESKYDWHPEVPSRRQVYFTNLPTGRDNRILGYRHHHGDGVWSASFSSSAEARLLGPKSYSRLNLKGLMYGVSKNKRIRIEVASLSHRRLMEAVREFIEADNLISALSCAGTPVPESMTRRRADSMSRMKDYSTPKE